MSGLQTQDSLTLNEPTTPQSKDIAPRVQSSAASQLHVFYKVNTVCQMTEAEQDITDFYWTHLV